LLELGPLPSAISERKAQLIGINDKIAENILEYLVNPKDIPSNKKVFIGVLQVSCNPGWRTKQGYIGDVKIFPEYAKAQEVKGNNGPYLLSYQKDRHQPMVVSAFPFIEAQTLDLRNSYRQQVAFATYLAGVFQAQGATTQAQMMSDFVDRLEGDAASRNVLPVISSYSDGRTFGYQIIPAFQALGEPTDYESGPENILHPVTFPALVLIVADKKELTSEKEGGRGWTHLALNVTSQWIP
jgi:hypothetical protein